MGLFAGNPGLRAQDLYDLSHTVRYADYLRRDGRYEAAQIEYRRALGLAPRDSTLLFGLMRSYRLGAQPGAALLVARDYHPDTAATPVLITEEYLQALLDMRLHMAAYRTAGVLPPTRRFHWHMGTLLLEERRREARAHLDASPFDGATWEPLVVRSEGTRHKKPWLATALSAVVPGTGRMYAGRWADGGFSLLNVGIFTWQAYRGFNRRGTRSFYGWFNAFFGVSFYIGNLYGSHRAAVIYNETQYQRIADDVELLLRPARQ